MPHHSRRVALAVTIALGAAFAALPAQSPPEPSQRTSGGGRADADDLLRVGGFGRDEIGVVAERKGFLSGEGIRVEYFHARASVDLMRDFATGTLDLVHTTPDNVIAWAEGQGADGQRHDFIFFIGGRRGLDSELTVAPEIKTFADLEGKVLAVDAYNTGYAPVLVYILRQHGLTLKKDYDLKVVGGGEMRRDAIKRGEVAGGFTGPDADMLAKGFHVIARANEYVPEYTRALGAARRDWAASHRALLVRYVRALLRAADWLLDPRHEAEAIDLLRAHSGSPRAEVERLYARAVGREYGWVPRLRIDREGLALILKIREVMGEMRPPLPSPDKYIDESYYRAATAGL